MAQHCYLGKFELVVMLALIHLGDEAYGVPIAREIEKYRARSVSLGSVYSALERLETKKLVTSVLGDPTPQRGGRAKRFFQLTEEGMRELRQTRRVLTQLWQNLPQLEGETA